MTLTLGDVLLKHLMQEDDWFRDAALETLSTASPAQLCEIVTVQETENGYAEGSHVTDKIRKAIGTSERTIFLPATPPHIFMARSMKDKHCLICDQVLTVQMNGAGEAKTVPDPRPDGGLMLVLYCTGCTRSCYISVNPEPPF